MHRQHRLVFTAAGGLDLLRDAQVCQHALSLGRLRRASVRVQHRRNMAKTLRDQRLDHACRRVALPADDRIRHRWLVVGKTDIEMVTGCRRTLPLRFPDNPLY